MIPHGKAGVKRQPGKVGNLGVPVPGPSLATPATGTPGRTPPCPIMFADFPTLLPFPPHFRQSAGFGGAGIGQFLRKTRLELIWCARAGSGIVPAAPGTRNRGPSSGAVRAAGSGPTRDPFPLGRAKDSAHVFS